MSEIHTMHLTENNFSLIKNGLKTVEYRLNDAKRQRIKCGDKIQFINVSRPEEKLTMTVKQILQSCDFRGVIDLIPKEHRGKISTNDQLKELSMIYKEYSQENGVMAFLLNEE